MILFICKFVHVLFVHIIWTPLSTQQIINAYFFEGGQTALQVAAENGLAEVCSILLSNGVDFSVADNRGKYI